MPVPDFKRNNLWVQSFRLNGLKTNTISGSVWQAIQQRCKQGPVRQKSATSYIGVENHFENFQLFTDWYTTQIGYGKGYHIDKDILFPGNYYYSSEVCVLVPQCINNLIQSTQRKFDLPTGVYRNGHNFRACITIDNEQIYLGTYETIEKAQDVYLENKIEYVKQVAENWKNEIDPRLYNALQEPTKLILFKGKK
jgi:hypothetical protein